MLLCGHLRSLHSIGAPLPSFSLALYSSWTSALKQPASVLCTVGESCHSFFVYFLLAYPSASVPAIVQWVHVLRLDPTATRHPALLPLVCLCFLYPPIPPGVPWVSQAGAPIALLLFAPALSLRVFSFLRSLWFLAPAVYVWFSAVQLIQPHEYNGNKSTRPHRVAIWCDGNRPSIPTLCSRIQR